MISNTCGILPTLCLNVLKEPTLCLNVLKELWRIRGEPLVHGGSSYRPICKPPRPPLRTKEVSAHAQSEDLPRTRIEMH
jgi:hypothetical protein